ncbi:MAG: histidine kinase [Pseudomonadota bacterium]
MRRSPFLLLACTAPCFAGVPGAAEGAVGLALAFIWLLMVGAGFHVLLRRHLRIDDRLADSETELGQQRHARALAETALAEAQEALARLAALQHGVRERERQRIARDIHDDLGQTLLALKIELAILRLNTGAGQGENCRRVESLAANVELAIRSLRTVIEDLRPPALQAGLRQAVESQLSEFSRISGIGHHLQADPDAWAACPGSLHDAVLFRVLQESLANVARHAQASEVRVVLRCRAGQLTMSVQDNGIGMASRRSSGGGLLGIGDRVAAIGGSFAIDSPPGAGTLLSLSLPLAPAPMAG